MTHFTIKSVLLTHVKLCSMGKAGTYPHTKLTSDEKRGEKLLGKVRASILVERVNLDNVTLT
jgi:hypothetical protein